MKYQGISYAIAGLLLLFGFIGAVIDLSRKKGRNPVLWLFISIITGGLGYCILWLMPSLKTEEVILSDINVNIGEKKCPLYAETIRLEANKCRFCGHLFDPAEIDRQMQALSGAVHTLEAIELKQVEESSIIGSAFLGAFFGGFFGLILGGMVAVLEWPREISVIVFFGAIIVGIIIMIRLAKKANEANKEKISS